MAKRLAVVNQTECVACGVCMKGCPRKAISLPKGIFAAVDFSRCVGCGACARLCPAGVIEMKEGVRE